MAKEKRLHSVAALFDSPDQIIKAAKKVRDDGYTKFDVNTPYPVHGMDKAMGIGRSKIGYVAIVFGLLGGTSMFLFMWWSAAWDYPLFLGGKPPFSLPALIPITFEASVLFAVWAMFMSLIFYFLKLPFNNHPLHDTDYMKNVSSDKYGLVIEVEDKLFDQQKVLELFKSLGAIKTELIYKPEEIKYRIYQPKFLLFLLIVLISTSALTYFSLNKLLYITPFDWMEYQDKVIPQESSLFFSDRRAQRPPVKGTVARGFIPYPYKGIANPKEVLSNPTVPSEAILKLGKKKFATFCSVCHGNLAEGTSRLKGQYPTGPTLHSDKIRNMKDGMLYHIITNGQNAMPSFEAQITRKERWAIVDYIRVLQRAKNAKKSDLEQIKKESSKNGL